MNKKPDFNLPESQPPIPLPAEEMGPVSYIQKESPKSQPVEIKGNARNKKINALAEKLIDSDGEAKTIVLNEFKKALEFRQKDTQKTHLSRLKERLDIILQSAQELTELLPEAEIRQIQNEALISYGLVYYLEIGRLERSGDKIPQSYYKISSDTQNGLAYIYLEQPQTFERIEKTLRDMCQQQFIIDRYGKNQYERFRQGVKGVIAASKFFHKEDRLMIVDGKSDALDKIDLALLTPEFDAQEQPNLYQDLDIMPDDIKSQIYFVQVKTIRRKPGEAPGTKITYINRDYCPKALKDVQMAWFNAGYEDADGTRNFQGFYIDFDPDDINDNFDIIKPGLAKQLTAVIKNPKLEWDKHNAQLAGTTIARTKTSAKKKYRIKPLAS